MQLAREKKQSRCPATYRIGAHMLPHRATHFPN